LGERETSRFSVREKKETVFFFRAGGREGRDIKCHHLLPSSPDLGKAVREKVGEGEPNHEEISFNVV